MARALAPYAAVLRARVRGQSTFRASFIFDLGTSLLTGLIELVEVGLVFATVGVLGGLDLAGGLLLFGLASWAFAIADLIVGHVDRLPRYILAGQLDVFYLRPQPVLLQLITSDISLKRLARTVVGLISLGLGLAWSDITWTTQKMMMLAAATTVGWLIFAAAFVVAGSLQFFLLRGDEVVNSITYGGSYAARQPASLFPVPLRLAFGFVVPVAFVAYLPTLVILDQAGPPWLPAWLAWWLPAVAGAFWGLALLLWRWGISHYQSGGG